MTGIPVLLLCVDHQKKGGFLLDRHESAILEGATRTPNKQYRRRYPTMIIVLDTNIVYKSRFKSPLFEALLDWLSRSEDDSLIIPQFVIDEAVNKCREAIVKIQLDLKRQLKELQEWTGEGLSLSLTDDKIQSTLATYEQTLKDTIRRASATIQPYPAASHEQLVAKCLARKKPFSGDGQKGYRDALIWESVLEILVEDEVTFITENSNDFFEKGKQVLHPHLLEDLLRNNIDANQITVFKDLHSFVDTYVKPAMEKLDLESVRSDLSFGLGRYDKEVIADAILQALCSYDYGDEINPHKIGLPSEVEDIIVSYVEDLSDFHVVDAYKLSSGAWFIEAIALASYQFDFFILKADWYGMDEEAPLDVISSDWNDHYIYPPAFMPIHKTFTLTFNESAGTVTCIEVNALASVLPYQK